MNIPKIQSYRPSFCRGETTKNINFPQNREDLPKTILHITGYGNPDPNIPTIQYNNKEHGAKKVTYDMYPSGVGIVAGTSVLGYDTSGADKILLYHQDGTSDPEKQAWLDTYKNYFKENPNCGHQYIDLTANPATISDKEPLVLSNDNYTIT